MVWVFLGMMSVKTDYVIVGSQFLMIFDLFF